MYRGSSYRLLETPKIRWLKGCYPHEPWPPFFLEWPPTGHVLWDVPFLCTGRDVPPDALLLGEVELCQQMEFKTPRSIIGYALDVSEEWEKKPWYLDTYSYDDNKRCPEDLGKP